MGKFDYLVILNLVQAVILKNDQIWPLQNVPENVDIHLKWGKFYYIAQYLQSCTGCYS